MEIIRMNDAHVVHVAAIEEQCFHAPWSEKSIRSELKNPLSLWLVALDRESVAGYIGSQTVCGEADVMNLAVSQNYRRQGVGEQLVRTLIGELARGGVHCLTLEVRASNEAAIALYNKLGFVQVGCRRNYYSGPKEDALILRKEWEV